MDDLAVGEDPLPLARRYDRVLLETATVAVGETTLPRESVLWRRSDRTTDARVLLFPRRPFAVSLAGRDPVVLGPTSVVVPWTNVPFQRIPLTEAGERSDWVWLAPDLSAELRFDRQPGARWRFPVEGPSLLRQRATHALVRSATAVPPAILEATVLEAMLTTFASQPSRPEPATNRAHQRVVVDAIGYICRTPEAALDLASTARASGVSVGHLCRVFKSVTGQTVLSFLNHYRLCLAMDRLSERNVDITTLALDLGFSSHSHFTARFRASFGHTPTRAREMLRAPKAS